MDDWHEQVLPDVPVTEPRTTGWFQAVGIALVAALFASTVVVVASVALDRGRSGDIVVAPATRRPITVEVLGAVASPGVVTLPADARMIDVIAAGGDLTEAADPAQLNLAARVVDGERIEIPARATEPPLGATPAGAGSVIGLVDLNTAGPDLLDSLPGIGPALAARIIEDRATNGPFTSIDDLDRVSGISPATVDELRPLVTVGG